ncbi:uncharacterized [Tachysurus ichikawai]
MWACCKRPRPFAHPVPRPLSQTPPIRTHVESQHASWRTNQTLLLRLSDTPEHVARFRNDAQKNLCEKSLESVLKLAESSPAFPSHLRPELVKDYKTGR